MNASQTPTTVTTPRQENNMTVSRKKECFKNFEWIPEADEYRDRLEEEDFSGIHEVIERLIEGKEVERLRMIARDQQFVDAKGLINHRDADLFTEEIEYVLGHINCDDELCQGEERAKFAASFGDWDLMIKGGEYFFQHQDPDYVTGNLTMLEPAIVDGEAKAIFTYNAINAFYVPMPCDKEREALMEDTNDIGKVVFAANRWLRENA